MNARFFERLLGYVDLGVVSFDIQTDAIYLNCISNLSLFYVIAMGQGLFE